jgi:hypothetical protein
MESKQTKQNTAPLNDELPEKEALNWPIKILQRLKSPLGCKRIKHTASKLSHRYQFCKVRGKWGFDFVASPDGMTWMTGLFNKSTEQELVIRFSSYWRVVDHYWCIGNASDSRASLGPAPLPMISSGKILIGSHAKQRTMNRGHNRFNDCFSNLIEENVLSCMILRTPLSVTIHDNQIQWLVPLPNNTIAVVHHEVDADYLYIPTILHPLQAQLQSECVNPWSPFFANGIGNITGVVA